jgi:CubicO group peptidase (beta-lactamase class C family)
MWGAAAPTAIEATMQHRLRVTAQAGLLAFCVALAPTVAAHAATQQAQRMIDAFSSWLQRWQVADGSMTVMNGDKLAGNFGAGSFKPNRPNLVASLSKAITAICTAKLVDAGQFNFRSRLGDVLSDYLAANPPKDNRVRNITVGELLTHSSGITYDPSQGDQGGAIEKLPRHQTNLDRQLNITFKRRLGDKPGASFTYNNMNYAALGYIIETVTGRPYADYCFETVLQPVGVTQTGLDPDWRVLSSYAGWKISTRNYARFLVYFLPSRHLLQTRPAQWPKFSFGDYSYTLGAFMRHNVNGGLNFWHSGSWQWNPTSNGSYYTVIREDVRYAVQFSPTVSDDAFSDLDSSIYTAATSPAAAIAAGRPLPAFALPK